MCDSQLHILSKFSTDHGGLGVGYQNLFSCEQTSRLAQRTRQCSIIELLSKHDEDGDECWFRGCSLATLFVTAFQTRTRPKCRSAVINGKFEMFFGAQNLLFIVRTYGTDANYVQLGEKNIKENLRPTKKKKGFRKKRVLIKNEK